MPSASTQASEPTVRRFARYLRVLDELASAGVEVISSSKFAVLTGSRAAKVRRDLLVLGGLGRKGAGYPVKDLRRGLRSALGLEHQRTVYVIGAGNLGVALLRYAGFTSRGFQVIGVFDNDPMKIGTSVDGHTVRSMKSLATHARSEKPHVAMLTTPADSAQEALEMIRRAKIPAILNFAPLFLKHSPQLTIHDVDLTAELLVLAVKAGR